jgi:DNA polymerase III subunit gamma/tau
MTKAYYRTWRPNDWNEVTGQDHVIQTLQNAIRGDHISHAYLFAGPRGTGKTTTARLLAKAANCLVEDLSKRPCNTCAHCKSFNEGKFLDLIEIDAASNTSVEDVRELREKINFSPSQGKYKVYIIDEVHMLSTPAFNALLKTLEEPPPHAIFILATTEVHKIPATVLSRCQRFEFRRISVTEMVKYLKPKIEKERISINDDALVLIARQATGSMRDAISLLDQLSSSGVNVTLDYTQMILGTATNQLVIDLVVALVNENRAVGMQIIQQALDSGIDPRQFARQVVEYSRQLLLIQMGYTEKVESPREIKEKMLAQSHHFSSPGMIKVLRLFNSAGGDSHSSLQPGLQLELAFAQAIDHLLESSSSTPEAPAQPEKTVPKSIKTPPVVNPPLVASKPTNSSGMHVEGSINKESLLDASPPASVGGIEQQDLSLITQRWTSIKSAMQKKRVAAAGLLNSCKPMVNGKGLVLGFQSDLLKSKMESNDNLDLTRQVILEICNLDVEVRCMVINSKVKGVPEDLEIKSDGLVGTALNQGGQIVHRE